jgi:predicted Zn-dependent protease
MPLNAQRRHTTGLLCLCLLCAAGAGCGEFAPIAPTGGGPGHRRQSLALTPRQELSLGTQAYQEVLKKYREIPSGPEVSRIREIGGRIVQAAQLRPLQREINLRFDESMMGWEFRLLQNNQVNAFCLPGGKVAVFTGLIPVAQNDDQLATVLAHEIAHALAHHASERIAREDMYQHALDALNGALPTLPPEERKKLVGLLGAGSKFYDLKYDRQQESEADHIGVFLMTFAGYDPGQALVFWQRMSNLHGGEPPEILSDHPSNAHRIEQIRLWVTRARAAKQAYERGDVVRD